MLCTEIPVVANGVSSCELVYSSVGVTTTSTLPRREEDPVRNPDHPTGDLLTATQLSHDDLAINVCGFGII